MPDADDQQPRALLIPGLQGAAEQARDEVRRLQQLMLLRALEVIRAADPPAD